MKNQRRSLVPFAAVLVFQLAIPSQARELGMEEVLFADLPVITVSKFAESVRTAPGIVTVVDDNQIRDMGARTLADVVNLVPGFEQDTSASSSMHSAINVRGGMNDGVGVLFMIDGQRMNDVESGDGLVYIQSLPLHNVKRVEFIRGPGSVLYGSNAFNGIVNVITYHGDQGEPSSASVSGGGFGAAGSHLNLQRSWGKTAVAASARWATDDGDEYKFSEVLDNTTTAFKDSADDPMDRALDFGLRLTHGGLVLEADHIDRRAPGLMPAGLVPYFDAPIPIERENDTSHFRTQAKYDWEIIPDLTLTPIVRHSRAKLRNLMYLLHPGALGVTGTSVDTMGLYGGPGQDTENFETELQASYRVGDHRLTAGTIYQWEKVTFIANRFNVYFGHPEGLKDTGAEAPWYEGVGSFGEEKGRGVKGVYLQDTWQVTAKTALNAGVRYDDYSDFGQAVTPRFGVVQELAQGLHAKLLYGRAYRAPTFLELYLKNNPVLLGNSDITAEKTETVEANLAYSPSPSVLTSVTVFHNTIRDLIGVDPTFLPLPRYDNLPGKQKDMGGEWELRYKGGRHKYASLYYAFVEPKDDAGDLRPNVARHKAGAVANWDVLADKVTVNVNAFFHGARKNADPSDPDHKVGDAAVVNMNFRVLSLFPGGDLDLGFFNLGDKQYKSPDVLDLAPDNIPNRGFQWMAKVTYNF